LRLENSSAMWNCLSSITDFVRTYLTPWFIYWYSVTVTLFLQFMVLFLVICSGRV